MANKIVFCCLLIMAVVNLHAQEKIFTVKGETVLRFNFLGLINPLEPNLSFGTEYRFANRWAVSADVAWVIKSAFFQTTKSSNGIIVRPAARYYIENKGLGYIEAELHYKYVNYKIQDWVGRNCVNNIPAYEEFTTFNYTREVKGLNIKTGFMARLSKNNKLWMEGYFGIGIRQKAEGIKDQSNSCFNLRRGIFSNSVANEKTILPAFPAGARLIYIFKKKRETRNPEPES